MKKIFFAATIILLIPFITTLYAADAPPQSQPDMDQLARQFEQKMEQQAKEELKNLVRENVLKEDITTAQQQGDSQAMPSADENTSIPMPAPSK